MTKIEKFNYQSIESISYTIGDILTGSQISIMFIKLNLVDNSNQSTKWRRLAFVLNEYQNKFNCGNKVIELLEYVFHPTSIWFNLNSYNDNLIKINK